MRSYWKRTNRGVWLGAILLIFLAGFIVFKQVRFTLEKPEIRDTARSFVTELLEINVVKDAEPGELLTDGQKQAQEDALKAILQKYWMEDAGSAGGYSALLDYGEGQSSADLEQALANVQKLPQNRVTEIQLDIIDRNLTINAEGTDWATVSCRTSNLTVKMTGYKAYLDSLFPDWQNTGYTGDVLGIGEEDEEEPDTIEDREAGYTVSFTLQMARSGGKWHITGASVYLYRTWSGPVEGGAES